MFLVLFLAFLCLSRFLYFPSSCGRLTFLIPAQFQIISPQFSAPLDVVCLDLLQSLYHLPPPLGFQRDIAALVDHGPVVNPVDLDQERLPSHLRLEERFFFFFRTQLILLLFRVVIILDPDRPDAQKHGPPLPVSVLKHVDVARPLYFLRRPIIPQRLPAILPGSVDTTTAATITTVVRISSPTAENPLLVSGLGAALGREQVVVVPAAKEVRALGDAVGGPPDHGRRRQRPPGRQVDLGDVDAKVLLGGSRRPVLEARGGAQVDFGGGVVPEELVSCFGYQVNSLLTFLFKPLTDDKNGTYWKGENKKGIIRGMGKTYVLIKTGIVKIDWA